MALQITNINELKVAKDNIKDAKESFDSTITVLKDNINSIQSYWQGEDAFNFQNKVISIIDNDLALELEEMAFEIKYLDRIISVLDNAQEEVKKRLND